MKWSYEAYKEEKRREYLSVQCMKDDELRQMFDTVNEGDFAGAIIVDELKMLPALKMKRLCASGYYQGDSLRGSIYICKEVHENKSSVRATLIHEMTHQLLQDHSPDFITLERVHLHSPIEPVPVHSFRLMAKYLLNNIVAKIDKGILPPEHLEVFKQSWVLKQALR